MFNSTTFHSGSGHMTLIPLQIQYYFNDTMLNADAHKHE